MIFFRDPPTYVDADFGGGWRRNSWQTYPGCGENVCWGRGDHRNSHDMLPQYASPRRVSCSQGIPSRPGLVILNLFFARRTSMFDIRIKQAPVSESIPAAAKTALGVGIPPRTPGVFQGTYSSPPIRTEETVSTKQGDILEATEFSFGSHPTITTTTAQTDRDKDIIQSPNAAASSAISAVFEQSLQVCLGFACARAAQPSAAGP